MYFKKMTKVVHKRISQGYNKAKLNIMKNWHFDFASSK